MQFVTEKVIAKFVVQEVLNEVNNEPELLKPAIADEETDVYGYGVKTKASSFSWRYLKSSRPQKDRQVRLNVEEYFFNTPLYSVARY